MTSTSGHTARQIGIPWTYEVHELSEGMSAIIYDDTGTRARTDHLSEEAAAFIVKAVNGFDDLVNGINALLGLIQLVGNRDDIPAEVKAALTNSHRLDEARAALKAVQS